MSGSSGTGSVGGASSCSAISGTGAGSSGGGSAHGATSAASGALAAAPLVQHWDCHMWQSQAPTRALNWQRGRPKVLEFNGIAREPKKSSAACPCTL